MDNPRITQEEIGIIKKAQAGDITAFNTLFKRYKSFVENVLFSYIDDWDESKDLTNVVFMKVYNKLHTFKAYDSFGGWLRTIANHTAIDYIRRNSRVQRMTKEDEDALESEVGDEEINIINKITYKRIIKEFDNFPKDTRKIFMLFYVNNLTIEQISERLSIPIGTIKSTLSRTRKQLQQQFKHLKTKL